jgi:hypothetical protein
MQRDARPEAAALERATVVNTERATEPQPQRTNRCGQGLAERANHRDDLNPSDFSCGVPFRFAAVLGACAGAFGALRARLFPRGYQIAASSEERTGGPGRGPQSDLASEQVLGRVASRHRGEEVEREGLSVRGGGSLSLAAQWAPENQRYGANDLEFARNS